MFVRTVLFVLVFLCPNFAHANDYIEADVIRLTKTQDPIILAARQATLVAKARRLEVGLHPNPSISWDREYFPGSPGESEDTLVFSIPIDLSPRRATLSHLAQSEVAIAEAEAAITESDVVVRVLTLYYDLLAEKQRSRIQHRVVGQLDEAARVVKKRNQAGRASGYDLARIEVEAALVASTHRQTQARVARIQAELTLLIGIESGQANFSGSLDPDGEIVSQSSKRVDRSDRQSLRLLRTAAKSAGKAGAEASRMWIPTLMITGGPRIGLSDNTRYGYVAGVSVEIPLFSGGKELRARAKARHRYARAHLDAKQRSAQIERESAQRVLNAAQKELRLFDKSTHGRVAFLERAAQSGYREGERSIMEFLDARRVRSTILLRRLELLRSLKQAEITLRAVRGEFE